jgi:hypothetical protein
MRMSINSNIYKTRMSINKVLIGIKGSEVKYNFKNYNEDCPKKKRKGV